MTENYTKMETRKEIEIFDQNYGLQRFGAVFLQYISFTDVNKGIE